MITKTLVYRCATILSAILFIAFISAHSAADNVPGARIRGISFLPRVTQAVDGTVKIDIPRSCDRREMLHEREKYPMAVFMAGCGGANPCLGLSIAVMLIPESIRTYDEVVRISVKNDFGIGPVKKINETLISEKHNGADRISLYYGPSFLMGSHIIGYYHSAEKKKTAKVILGLTFIDDFSDDEWQAVLVNSVDILKSVRFDK